MGSGQNGDEVHATWKGTVVRMEKSGNNDGFGTFLVVEYTCSDIPAEDKKSMGDLCKDGQSVYVRYAHMQENSNGHLTDGSEVKPGDKIGVVGKTGNVEAGSVLHIETRIGKTGEYRPKLDPKCDYGGYNSIGKGFIDPTIIFPGICG